MENKNNLGIPSMKKGEVKGTWVQRALDCLNDATCNISRHKLNCQHEDEKAAAQPKEYELS